MAYGLLIAPADRAIVADLGIYLFLLRKRPGEKIRVNNLGIANLRIKGLNLGIWEFRNLGIEGILSIY